MLPGRRLLRSAGPLLGLLTATLPAGAAAQGPAWRPLDDDTTVFVGVNLLPLDRDTVLPGYSVVVAHGRIAAVGPDAQLKIPAGARRIDGTGRWLMPSLADAHVHLAYGDLGDENPALLRLFVAEGVTTVINLLGLPEHLPLRDSVAAGTVLGPLIATSGFYVGEPFTRTAAQADSAVRRQRADGYDFIKIHGNMSAEAFQALMAAARREGIRVVGHLPRNLGLEVALDGGQVMIAHAEEYLEGWFGFQRSPRTREEILALVDTAAAITAAHGTWVTPTLTVFAGIPAQRLRLDSVLATPAMQHIPARLRREWQPDQNRYRDLPLEATEAIRNEAFLLSRLTLALQQAGVPLLMGTDAMASAAVLPGFSAHQELEAMVEAGLTPYQALRAATVNVARFLGVPGEFGTVTVGARADLLLLPANPLSDIRATADLQGVMVRGRWLDRDALDRLLAAPDSRGN